MNFDLDALRTMVVGTELGGFSHAAVRLNRSPSAVSMQLRKLENQSGRRLFKRNGRGLVLTEAGDIVLQYARRMLALNDELGLALGAITRGGTIRVGMPQDLNDAILPTLLARYSKTRPETHVEVRAGRNYTLAEEVTNGRLDLALAFAPAGKGGPNTIATVATGWFGRRQTPSKASTFTQSSTRSAPRNPSPTTVVPSRALSYATRRDPEPTDASSHARSNALQPGAAPSRNLSHAEQRDGVPTNVVPLVVFDGPCLFREMAIAALAQSGTPWRLAMTTPSLASLCCGVQAGLGITVRTAFAALPRGLAPLPVNAGLPALPPVDLVLYCTADPSPAVQTFKTLLLEIVGRECKVDTRRARKRTSTKAA
jgi:DNA-binding transcriptional LysR family regulator